METEERVIIFCGMFAKRIFKGQRDFYRGWRYQRCIEIEWLLSHLLGEV